MENENTSAASFITIKGEQYSTDLERLDLRSRDLTDADIEPLKHMTNLTELVLFENQFSDISVLSGLAKLTRLDLWGNRISDVSALSGLVNLAELDLIGNCISDVSGLNGLVNLRFLKIDRNPISDEQIAGLKAALPNCYVIFYDEDWLSLPDEP